MEATAAEDPQKVGPNQMQFSLMPASTTNGQLIVLNHFGDQNQSVGPVMKCAHFKVHAVTDQSILINWALICVPTV